MNNDIQKRPVSSGPNPTGGVGPSPSENVVPDGDPTRFGGGQGPKETGEEDPGIANAGGVNATNAGK